MRSGARWSVVLLCAVAAMACRSYRPAPLSLHVTSEPSGATALVDCPNAPHFSAQQSTTPVTFRIPSYAPPCVLTVSKDQYETSRQDLGRDVLKERRSVRAGPSSEPIQLQPGATPFSLLGALLHRWFDNAAQGVTERAMTAIVHDANVHVKLVATPQP